MYQRSFQAFIDNSTVRRPAMLNFQKDGIRQAMLKIINRVNIDEPLRVLGIGSGSGESDLLILQAMAEFTVSKKKKTPTIHNVIVEPSSSLLDQFKIRASSSSLESAANVSFEWQQKTFSEFNQETSTEKRSFDLIHFVHSLYYFDIKAALRTCFEQWLKAEHGVVVCYVHTENSYLAKVSKRFKGKLSCGSERTSFCTHEELAAIAEENSWNYCVPLKENFQINVTPCLTEPTSAEADPLIDFLTHEQSFRANAEQELFNSWMELIESLAFTDDRGEKFVKGESSVVIIYK